jgi:hypothetical protein
MKRGGLTFPYRKFIPATLLPILLHPLEIASAFEDGRAKLIRRVQGANVPSLITECLTHQPKPPFGLADQHNRIV